VLTWLLLIHLHLETVNPAFGFGPFKRMGYCQTTTVDTVSWKPSFGPVRYGMTTSVVRNWGDASHQHHSHASADDDDLEGCLFPTGGHDG
jgi:hypothetical protein